MSKALDRNAIEAQLFTWQDIEEVDFVFFQFYDVVTKVQIGQYPVGSEFKVVVVNFEHGFIEVFPNENSPAGDIYALNYSIGEPLT